MAAENRAAAVEFRAEAAEFRERDRQLEARIAQVSDKVNLLSDKVDRVTDTVNHVNERNARLEDHMTVIAAIQARDETKFPDMKEWLAAQDKAIIRHANWLAEHEAAIHRIEGLIEASLRGRGSNGGGHEG